MRIGITGHQRLPQKAVPSVERGIADVILRAPNGLVGISVLAAGADQLFASVILRAGGRLHVILPCHDYETTFSDRQDLQRFRQLLNRADAVETLPYENPSEDAFLSAGCRVADLSDLLIAVWDGMPSRGKGGTADIVNYARGRGIQVEVVWPLGIVR